MKQLPTASEPSPSRAVLCALTDIEMAKGDAEPAVADFLDHVAQLIVQHGDPDEVLARVIDALAVEDLKALAAEHHLTLHTTRADEQPERLLVIWKHDGGLAIVPQGLRPRAALHQLHAALAERAEEERLSRDFQDSVARGHVEDVAAWHARVTKAAS
ncbi:hypothetical protein [Streptomyces sp. I5]|uniref:hypothetical protein n=1 Tax=Streptomyces sp. I5 TaxID=2759947 RepID=UPI0018EE5CC9|nr:hypothetical protein [Streptomyces sp. I5]MBJ6633342.1 hypothetical protein [Streptomyces sp. I5]